MLQWYDSHLGKMLCSEWRWRIRDVLFVYFLGQCSHSTRPFSWWTVFSCFLQTYLLINNLWQNLQVLSIMVPSLVSFHFLMSLKSGKGSFDLPKFLNLEKRCWLLGSWCRSVGHHICSQRNPCFQLLPLSVAYNSRQPVHWCGACFQLLPWIVIFSYQIILMKYGQKLHNIVKKKKTSKCSFISCF